MRLKWTKIADGVIRDHPAAVKEPGVFVGSDKASQRLAAIQFLAFSKLANARTAKGLEERHEALQQGIGACFESKMFPVYRQPYAALRDDMIVADISTGESPQIVAAFMNGTKRYFRIDPHLFPQPFHPVRVVHTWTLAMLALWAAVAPADSPIDAAMFLERGVDLGVVIYHLLFEVHENVGKSHGKESSFAKAVQRKFEEVKIDMTRGDQNAVRQMLGKLKTTFVKFAEFGDTMEA